MYKLINKQKPLNKLKIKVDWEQQFVKTNIFWSRCFLMLYEFSLCLELRSPEQASKSAICSTEQPAHSPFKTAFTKCTCLTLVVVLLWQFKSEHAPLFINFVSYWFSSVVTGIWYIEAGPTRKGSRFSGLDFFRGPGPSPQIRKNYCYLFLYYNEYSSRKVWVWIPHEAKRTAALPFLFNI